MQFKKRYYRNPSDFFRDVVFPFKNRKRLREISQSGLISAGFRERLMLAVTGVNGCRYCSYFHTRLALQSGIPAAEISRLLAGDVDRCPPEEAVAIMFAQHWAETNARPEPAAVARLTQTYGHQKTQAILLILRMIRLGNLTGNTFDFWVYCLSFGKLGK